MTNLIENIGLSKSIFEEAFTHSSASLSYNFERLEFLGDSLIEAKVTEMLFKTHLKSSEGELSRWRSAIVNQNTLSLASEKLNLVEHLKASADQLSELKKNERIKASLFESLCGAIMIEKGWQDCSVFIETQLLEYTLSPEKLFKLSDPKTIVQEVVQNTDKITPTYHLDKKEGPSHDPMFYVSLKVGESTVSKGTGKSLKEAEKTAAALFLKDMEKNHNARN